MITKLILNETFSNFVSDIHSLQVLRAASSSDSPTGEQLSLLVPAEIQYSPRISPVTVKTSGDLPDTVTQEDGQDHFETTAAPISS